MQAILMPPSTRLPSFDLDDNSLESGEPHEGFESLESDEAADAGNANLPIGPSEPIDTNFQRINISPETVLAAAALYPPDQAELVIWSHKYARDHKWDLNIAAREFKVSTTTVSRIWRGQYRQGATIHPPGVPRKATGKNVNRIPNPDAGKLIPIDTFCERVALYRSIVLQRPEGKLPFIETSTFRKIRIICEKTLLTQGLNLIIGESQIGKTTALRELARRNINLIHVPVPAAASCYGFIIAIGKALGVCDCNQQRMMERIKARLNGETLLILDRAHFIFETYTALQIVRVLAVIQELADGPEDGAGSPCGILICATKVWEDKSHAPRFTATFKQLSLRATLPVLHLGSEPTAADIEAVTRHYNLPDPGPNQVIAGRQGQREDSPVKDYPVRDTIKQIAKSGLGKVTKLFAAAAASAAKQNLQLDWQTVIAYIALTDHAGRDVKG